MLRCCISCAGLAVSVLLCLPCVAAADEQLDRALNTEVQWGRAANARRMLRQGADPDYLPPGGQTALYTACEKGDAQLVTDLLAAGADVARGRADGQQPIHAAAGLEAPDVLQMLLAHGADPDARGWRGDTPLMYAAQANRLACAAALLEAGADANLQNDYGTTALHEVAIFSNQRVDGGLALAALLFDHGANPALRAQSRQSGVTPLHIAALTGKPGLIALMVERGADVNVPNDFGNTALHLAGKFANRPAVQELQALGARVDDIYLAATVDDAGLTQRLLAAGQAAYVDWEGEPPLCWAVRNGSDAVVRTLLASPQQAGIIQPDLDQALILACRAARREVAGWLLAAGASVAAVDNMGDPVVYQSLNPGVLELLVGHGADLHAYDRNGQTLLHAAAGRGMLATLDWLLAHGLPVDLPAQDGRTPLMAAADSLGWKGDALLAMDYLLQRGADVNASDAQGDTALHRLARGGGSYAPEAQTQAAWLLVAAGADVNARNAAGDTPLDAGSSDGWCGTGLNFELLNYLVEQGAEHSERWRGYHAAAPTE
jgi:cytohesin